MPEWIIRPYEGAGPVDFDMITADVADILGPAFYERPRDAGGQEWGYTDLHIVIAFDADLRCEYVGFNPGSVGIVDGIPLVGAYAERRQQLEQRGYTLFEPTVPTRFGGNVWSGHTVCSDLGITIRRDSRLQEHISDAAAFRRGYWEAKMSELEELVCAKRGEQS